MGAPGCPTPNKRGYKNPATARRHMWGLLTSRKSQRRDWQRLHVYKCPCGLFHVGHGRKAA
jgi:hypothetical protein